MSINGETDINMPTVSSASESGVDCDNPERVRKSNRKRSQTLKFAEYNRKLQEGDDEEEEEERVVTKEEEIGKYVATKQEKEPNDTTDEKDKKMIEESKQGNEGKDILIKVSGYEN